MRPLSPYERHGLMGDNGLDKRLDPFRASMEAALRRRRRRNRNLAFVVLGFLMLVFTVGSQLTRMYSTDAWQWGIGLVSVVAVSVSFGVNVGLFVSDVFGPPGKETP